MSRIMEVPLYSADEKSVFVDSKAISCREESCGSDIENKWVLILWTPSGWSIMSILELSGHLYWTLAEGLFYCSGVFHVIFSAYDVC